MSPTLSDPRTGNAPIVALSRTTPSLGFRQAAARLHTPRLLLDGEEPMVRLDVIPALLRLLVLGEPLGLGGKLRFGFPAGTGRFPEHLPHSARVQLREVEV